jgi:general secretion pathway protein G
MKKNDEGFTLIELLIVIVILGILAAVVVFAVGGITDRGQTSSCEAERKTVEVAVEAYYAQEQAYPADDAAISDFLRSGASWYGVAPAADGTLAYINDGATVCNDVAP